MTSGRPTNAAGSTPATLPGIASPGDLEFLKKLMIFGFFLRVVLALTLEWSGYSERLAPDETTYATTGFALAQYWSGELLVKPYRFFTDQALGYFYVNGVFFYVFGASDLPIKVLNAFIGVLVGRQVFLLALQLFGAAAARRAATLTTYFPSLVLWSAVNIRDVWVILLLVLVSRYSLEVIRGYSRTALLKLCAAIYALSFFRDYLVFAVALPPIVAMLIGRRGHLLRNFAVATVAAIAVAVLLEQGIVREQTQSRMSLEALSEIRRDLATGGSAYYRDVDISTPGGALAFLPVGLVYFFFSPFPWQMNSALRLMSAPEMVLIYYLALPTWRGIAFAVRNRLRDCIQVLMLTALVTVTYALTEGNVGTLYRHRAQAMAFYLIFAAVGLEVKKTSEVARKRVAA
jgi:hypothetical protein